MAGEPILIAEDDPHLAAGIAQLLRAEGHRVDIACHGDAVCAAVRSGRPALLILDIGLPGRDGFAILGELRRQGWSLPILLLTARSAEADKVRGLDLGADDYLAKPFGVLELLARIRALLRRCANPAPRAWRRGAVHADLRTGDLRGPATTAVLSDGERRIFTCLAAAAGTAVPRRALIRDVWGDAPVTGRAVDMHVVALRRKLAAVGGDAGWIATSHGIGYALIAGDAERA